MPHRKNDSLSREHEHQSLIAVMEKDAEATLERVKRGHAIGTAKIKSNTKLKMAVAEKKHKRVVNIITKRERATITAKDNLHALDIEKKDKDISVSLSFDIVALLSSITHNFFVFCQALIKMNDERKCRDRKLHKKWQVSKDKTYAQLLAKKDARQVSKDKTHARLLAIKDANHYKIVTDLCQDHTAQLRKSDANAEAAVEAAAEQYQNLKRSYSSVLDDIKIKHRSSLRKEQSLHAQHIERKNEIVKKMWRDMEATREMLWETFNEMNDFKRTMRMASTSAEKAAATAERAICRSSMLYNKLRESSNLINELKDEIRDEKKVISDLRSKVDEYDVIIDCMEQEYEDKCNEHQTKISSMKAYYEEIITKQSPRYVMKHWVKNKESRGKCILHLRIFYYLNGHTSN